VAKTTQYFFFLANFIHIITVYTRVVWTDTNDIRGIDGPNHCGGSHPDLKLSVPIDVTIRHTGESVDVSFGSTLDEHPCNESFGIDDVIISIL
jgi:hypothetical protein